MNKKTISAIAFLLSLFTACDMTGSDPERSPNGKAAVRVQINADGIQGRTVKPALALQDVTTWELRGGKQGDAETLIIEFANAEGSTVSIEPGDWRFTLTGYKEGAAILTGTISQTISAAGTNVLNFTVAPVMEGQGTLNITVELPAGSGITGAQVFKDGQLHASLTPVDDRVVFEGTYDAGAYYFSVRLLKDGVLYGAVSEAAHIWANLQSEKTYTLTLENLNLTYIITYHLWDEEIEIGYYQYTDAAITLDNPSRPDHVFRGWYQAADLSGDTVTGIPAGSTGDRDFYARWTAVTQTPSSYSLADALAWISANAEEEGVYNVTVNADESLSPTMLHYSLDNVSIILNGGATERTISLSSSGSLFTINSGVTLTLENNVVLRGQGGNNAALVRVNDGGTLAMGSGSKIHGNSNSSGNGGGVYVNSGTLTMSGGDISGNSVSSSSYGGGVYVNSGTFTMSDGTVSGNTGGGVYVNSGTLTMSGGVISGNSASSYGGGGGVYVYSNSGTFTMNGGEISGNTASSGGGVYSNGTFTMNNGAISGNIASYSGSSYSYSAYGGGVYSSGTFTMNNGEISDNSASSSSYDNAYGGGVYVNYGTFTMNNGAISGNNASSGGGVYVRYGTFTMNNGEISGNSARSGGGVYVDGGTFTKQSDGIIYGSDADDSLKNTATSGDSYGHAVYVESGSKRRNATAGAGVMLDSRVDGAAGGWEVPLAADLSLIQSLAWISSNAIDGGYYAVTLSANETVAPQTLSYGGKIVHIALDGGTAERTVGLNSNGSLFTIENGVTLTLGNNVTLQGRNNNTASVVRAAAGGMLVMNEGAKITGNRNVSSSGGGAYVDDGGAFAMDGGEISGNTATFGGGVSGTGVFAMSGGEISGNTSAYDGGGVSVDDGGAWTMTGGTISGNTSAAGYGGGAAVNSGGAFVMSGGEVSGNSASRGGGVFVDGGTFAKQSGGTIYGSNASDSLKNTATSGDSYGHAVYVSSGSKKRNSTAGAGVALDSAAIGTAGGWEELMPSNVSLAESLAWISANIVEGGDYVITINTDESLAPRTLSSDGKNINITLRGDATERTVSLSSSGSLFTIESGVTLTLGNNVALRGRTGNNASLVRVNSGGTLSMGSGSKITGNSNSSGNGGGVYVDGGAFVMSGGEVGGNTAARGGGLYIAAGAGSFIKRSGGTVYGSDAGGGLANTAADGGGYGHAVYNVDGSLVNIDHTVGEGTALNSEPIAESLAWISANAVEGGVYNIIIKADASLAPQTLSYGGKNVAITLLGDATERTVSLSSSGSLFTIGSGVTLTLGNNVTLRGRTSNNASLVRVNSGGTLVMESGSAVSGNTTSSYGGGVSVSSSGTFTMSGGTISGNTSNYYGGGVSVGGGTFTMSGGTISGNTASYGGGVDVSSGTFTKQSGGVIYGSNASDSLKNTASGDSYGHAVYVESGSKRRNSTAGEGVTLNSGVSGSNGGWL
jgi:uncharacterized repeat protein (TIGR02543 family)